MAIIVSQPSGLLSAFREAPFQVIVQHNPGTTRTPAISIEVQGVEGETTFSSLAVATLGGITISAFEFDIRSQIQSLLSLENFPALGTPGVFTNGNWQTSVSVDLYEWHPDADGILQKDATPTTLGPFDAIPSTRFSDDPQNLEEHIWSLTIPAQSLTSPLTRKPVYTLISLDDSEWIPIWDESMTHARVRVFGLDGSLVSDGIFETGHTLGDDPQVRQIAVGPAQLNQMTGADYISGTPASIDANVGMYVVQVGALLSPTFFLGWIPNRQYYVKPSFCRTARVHFLNSFGFVDSFSVWNNLTEEYQTSVFLSEKSQPIQFDPSLPGTYRVSAQGRRSLGLTVGGITEEQRLWLSRELGLSVQIKLERNSELFAVHMEENTFVLSDTGDRVPEIPFNLLYSNSDNSQTQ